LLDAIGGRGKGGILQKPLGRGSAITDVFTLTSLVRGEKQHNEEEGERNPSKGDEVKREAGQENPNQGFFAEHSKGRKDIPAKLTPESNTNSREREMPK